MRRSPQNGIADSGRPHDQGGRGADKRVHQGDCEEIDGNIASDLLRDVDRLPLAGEPGQDLDKPPQETVTRNEEEVEKDDGGEQPGGEASRPAKTLVRIAPPSKGPGELRCGPTAPILLVAVRNVRSILIGASRYLSRSRMRGMPSGSFAIHAWAGPETAAPSPTIVANTKRMSRRAPSALGTRNPSSARKAGCIKRLSMTAKIKGRTI